MSDFDPNDFPPKYKADMVAAYPDIAAMTADEAWFATPAEREEAFARVLAAKNLRRTHQQFLDDLHPPKPPAELTREELIELCTDGVVPHEKWRDRDTAGAQIQLGQARALLAAGCKYHILVDGRLSSDNDTVWVEITWNGFGHFDYGGEPDDKTFYIPQRRRLDRIDGGDWY
ncbi:hypothetical protein [Gordonia sp. OPL2]|uniref:hypothetical protein n=1 Tax=Gordonia sp. OPL2 TaxID=2486274 RepID=UPI00165649F1|nr:hypothetical protein [Gordonia sp. OPL2]ROZ88986.1 hypothetical protein EEB19_19950 [Gordonia sp. OPL2]